MKYVSDYTAAVAVVLNIGSRSNKPTKTGKWYTKNWATKMHADDIRMVVRFLKALWAKREDYHIQVRDMFDGIAYNVLSIEHGIPNIHNYGRDTAKPDDSDFGLNLDYSTKVYFKTASWGGVPIYSARIISIFMGLQRIHKADRTLALEFIHVPAMYQITPGASVLFQLTLIPKVGSIISDVLDMSEIYGQKKETIMIERSHRRLEI